MIARAVSQANAEAEAPYAYQLPLERHGLAFLLIIAAIGSAAAAVAIFGV